MGSRILVISDIHNQYYMLKELLFKVVKYNPDNDKLIINGDLIDRGFYAKEVLILCKNLHEKYGVHINMGNHEDMFLDTIDGGDGMNWLYNGGYYTMYSLCPKRVIENSDFNHIVDYLKINYEKEIEFLRNLTLYYEDNQNVIVNAGVNPVIRDYKNSTKQDFLMIRDMFFRREVESTDKTVIFGHTPVKRIHNSDNPWFVEKKNGLGYEKIGIDGGAGGNRQLNCLIIQDGEYTFDYVTYHKMQTK